MGLDILGATILCGAKSAGVDFSASLMIGRQQTMISRSRLSKIFAASGITADSSHIACSHYAEPFFEALGAREVHSLDASEYEHATIIHDLNEPIPESLRSRFNVVFDGGSLEHVFNVPIALKNCMEMVKAGGYFVQEAVSNNSMGHGFWQISPELVFRVFDQQNGFEIIAVFIAEWPNGPWYAVSDPAEVGCRVELRNRNPANLITVARKTHVTRLFSTTPQQSDYSLAWNGAIDAAHSVVIRQNSWRGLIPEIIKAPIRNAIHSAEHGARAIARGARERVRGPYDRPYFRRVDCTSIAAGHFGGFNLTRH